MRIGVGRGATNVGASIDIIAANCVAGALPFRITINPIAFAVHIIIAATSSTIIFGRVRILVNRAGLCRIYRTSI